MVIIVVTQFRQILKLQTLPLGLYQWQLKHANRMNIIVHQSA